MKAKYVSVWDDGTEIITDCEIDISNNHVSNVVVADYAPDGTCDEEFIEFGNNQIRAFYNADTNTYYVDGRPI